MQRGIYTIRPGLTIEVEAATQVELFEELASAAEVFGERECGLCHSEAIYPVYRHVGKLEFAEWACPDCGARLSLGNTMEGGRLFPIRALTAEGKPDREKGSRGEHNGWTKYRGPASDGGPPTPTPRKAAAPAEAGGPSPAGISREQWQQLQAELRGHFISDRAFLRRWGVESPRELPAQHFGQLLEIARKPDDKLRAAQQKGGQ